MTTTSNEQNEGQFGNQSCVGIVTHVAPSRVELTLPPIGTSSGGRSLSVGDFVIIHCGESGIMGQVNDVRLPNLDTQANGATAALRPVAQVQLLSTINLETRAVTDGVSLPPTVGNQAHLAHPQLVQFVAEARGKSGQTEAAVTLSFAKLHNSQNTTLSFTPEMMFGRHSAVLGTTGGGKSWTLAKIMEESAKHNSKVILFDATGEFCRLGKGTKHVHLGHDPEPSGTSTEVVLPYFELTEGDLFSIFKPSGQSQAPKLRTAIKSLKLAQLDQSVALNGLVLKANKSKTHFQQAYRHFISQIESSAAAFDIRRLPQQIENECVKPNRSAMEQNFWGDVSGVDQAYCVPLVNRVQDIISSPNLAPIFAPEGKKSLLTEVEDFFEDRNTKILCVSMKYLSFQHNAREIIANAAARYLLGKSRTGYFQNRPLLVVVDEAHQFLDKSVLSSDATSALDSFALIAKEGRKYALNICLSTQRPRDIPEDVLSQIGTFVVHRLINDRDRAIIERASGDVDRSVMETLPTLSPGEAVVLGVAFPVPTHVKVEPPVCAPESSGPDYQKHWR